MVPLPVEMRQIIALDLDNFYVGCERLRDPSLVGKPVGIKQKGILATCSYEARAMGVDKLMSLKEAKAKCPELIIVLGEDLTPYRRYSRLVFNLVRSLVGPSIAVEKLGMDELFVDCTPLIKKHLESGTFRRREDGQIWFALSEEDSGFWYSEDRWAGHRLENEEALAVVQEDLVEAGQTSSSSSSSSSLSKSNPYLIASHLALHLRTQIQTHLGLGTSAGISHTKLLSKLIASIHKPADQTSLSPLFLSTSPPTLHPSTTNLIQRYLDPLPLRKLPGFGHTIVSKINQSLSPPPPPDAPPPTLLLTRTQLSLATFKTLFTPRLAPILYSLLHGEDPSPVVPSPEFPNQIGVEESYATNHVFDWRRFGEEVERLLNALLVRLEEELVVEMGGKRRKWVRWPKKLRMEIRRGWDLPIGREGKSMDMPVGVFDLGVAVGERVGMLMGRKGGEGEGSVTSATTRKVGGVVGSLMRGLVKEGEKEKGFELYVINFAALSLSTHAPGPSIEQWTKPSSSSSTQPSLSSRGEQRAAPPDLDLSTLDALPSDLRAEVLDSYGLSERDVAELLEEQERRPSKLRKVDHQDQEASSVFEEEEAMEGGEEAELGEFGEGGGGAMEAERGYGEVGWGSQVDEDGEGEGYEEEEEEEDEQETKETCSTCGMEVFPFALAAHALFHVEDG